LTLTARLTHNHRADAQDARSSPAISTPRGRSVGAHGERA